MTADKSIVFTARCPMVNIKQFCMLLFCVETVVFGTTLSGSHCYEQKCVWQESIQVKASSEVLEKLTRNRTSKSIVRGVGEHWTWHIVHWNWDHWTWHIVHWNWEHRTWHIVHWNWEHWTWHIVHWNWEHWSASQNNGCRNRL